MILHFVPFHIFIGNNSKITFFNSRLMILNQSYYYFTNFLSKSDPYHYSNVLKTFFFNFSLILFPQAGPDMKYFLGFVRTQLSTSVTIVLVFGPKVSNSTLRKVLLFLQSFCEIDYNFNFSNFLFLTCELMDYLPPFFKAFSPN